MDCLVGMKKLGDNSVDLVVTDPPYGYSFMGKDWDKVVPKLEIWQQCLRVLKPGAFCFVMSAPRQDVQSQMVNRLLKAGFEIGFTPLYWAYASGFPKASNISKMVDKRGTENERYSELSKELCNYLKSSRELLNLSQKDISKHFLSKTGGLTGCVWNWENGANIPTMEQWNKLKELLKLNNKNFIELIERAILKREEAEREVIGKDKDRGKDTRSIFGMGIGQWNITKSATPQAKALEGSYAGFQPKPAVEIILVAMKPLSEKTYVDQALKNGKGITWLENCRVPYENENDFQQRQRGIIKDGKDQPSSTYNDNFGLKTYDSSLYETKQGRFPANLLVSDDVLNDGSIRKSGKDCIRRQPGTFVEHYYGGIGVEQITYGDSGSFSHYFDLDKWFINKLPESVQKTFPFLIVPKASSGEKNKGIEGLPTQRKPLMGEFKKNPGRNTPKSSPTPKQNFHPTVKPIQLMSYLITLSSRQNDLILDPFMGSGTTAIASRLLTRNFIGFELNKEYHKIAEARIKDYMEQKKLCEIGGVAK